MFPKHPSTVRARTHETIVPSSIPPRPLRMHAPSNFSIPGSWLNGHDQIILSII